MVEPYQFTVIDAGQSVEAIFEELRRHISELPLQRIRNGVRARTRTVRSAG
jgi:hypothetical protein